MSVTVTPDTFQYVFFDSALTQRVADDLVSSMRLTDREIRIEVDETTPLARIRVSVPTDSEPITIVAQSGAFEDTRRPRHQSEAATATSLGRVLYRVADRLHGGFGEAPADDQLTLAQMAAWETYCVGRLERLGIAVNQQRWRYNFRNRHGFSDSGDAAFEQLWSSNGVTWGELTAISDAAIGDRS
jgi:hypothetical protein